ncbi:MAG: BatD family protein [Flavobacteriales bacterium]|nr:BatD family protein [Flavobacteriales bacterium]MDG1395633.1 BatD family protein [Flavobacteriales bacterium]
MKNYLFLLFFSVKSVLLTAQTFSASINKNKVGLNEQFTLTYTLDDSGDRFVAPNLSNFSVLAGPSTSSSTSIINGKVSKETSYTYRLRSKKVGAFTIYPAKIRVKGKELKSNTLSIQVLKSSPKATSNTSPEAIAKRNVFVQLELSNSNPYVGEQVIASYKLYFSQEVRSPELLETPTFTGFWHEEFDLGKNYPISETYIKGKKFQVALLKKLVLIPQHSGALLIAPMELEVPVATPTNQRDFFGRRTSRIVNIICSTGKRMLEVKALPKQNMPVGFSGAVGSFEFTTKLDRDSIQTNESANLSIRVSGSGNLRMIELPEFDVPIDIEAYEPKYKENINLEKFGLSGFKREEYLLIPRNKGVYKIGSVRFSYFNPSKKKYITVNSPSYTLKVKGASLANTTPVVLNSFTKEDVSFIGKDILYIKTSLTNTRTSKDYFFGSTDFYLILFIPLFLVIAVLVILLLSKKSIINLKKFKEGSSAKQAIRVLNDPELELHTAIENSLQTFMFKKWRLKRAQFNKADLLEVFHKKQVPLNLINDFNKLIESSEMARFTSGEYLSNDQDLKALTIELLEQLENY